MRRAVAATACGFAWVLASRPAEASEPLAPAATQATGESPTHHGSVFADPLGFLLFGPTLGVELGTGRLSGTLYGRWLNVGLLAQSLFLNGPRHDGFDFSYGVGVRGRYYFWGGLSGPHIGAGVEYISTRIEDTADLIATNAHYLVPQLEGGYRLALGSLFVGAAVALGYALQLSSSVDNLAGGSNASSFSAIDETKPFVAASLDLGLYF